MNADNDSRPSLKEIFLAARERPCGEEREAYLRQRVGEDEVLRRRVEQLLLVAENSAPNRLDAALATLELPDEDATSSLDISEHPTIGPYKLLTRLGEGGMGEVFVAEQREPVERTVAIKLIKPGMDSKEVIARFESERQALALMNHPNIARVLEAGQTDDGRPYFVMDYVRGIPITDYCDKHQLTMHERLELFVLVCQAVQHAHQKGVIHRDLKPSNVLVELHDVRHVPKVIDFGLAKATNRRLTERTLFTQASDMIGTPLYMSPEQAELSGLDVDTRSDVYSLGVLLYELTTGTTPFDRDTLRTAGFDEMRRIIREDEPPRPSHRISTINAAEHSTLSGHQPIDTPKLERKLELEFDWIVMKALEKDRVRRYESASAFAADIERYLQEEPVEACPPSMAYTLRKFARRHRGLVKVAVVIALLILVAAGLLWNQRSRTFAALAGETEQRRQAQENLRLANDQQTLAEANFRKALQAVDHMLTHVADGSLVDVPQMTPVRMQLFDEAITFYQELLTEHASDTQLRFKLAVAQSRAATVAQQLQDFEVALVLAEASVKRLEPLVDRQPMNPTYARALAESLRIVGEVRRWHLGDVDAIVSYNQRGAEIAQRAGASTAYARSLAGVGQGHIQRADYPAAIETLKEAIPLLQSSFDESNDKEERSLGFAYFNLGKAYRNLRDYANAVDALRSAVNTHKQVLELRPESLSTGVEQVYALKNLAGAFSDIGDTESAIATHREGLEFSLKHEKRFPSSRQWDYMISDLARNLCQLLRRSGKETDILSMIDGLAPVTSNDFTLRGTLHSFLGDIDSATEDFSRAIEIDPENCSPTEELVKIHMQNDDGEKAVELHRTFMRIARRGRKTTYYPFNSQRLAAMQCRVGNIEEARRSLIRGFEGNRRIRFDSLIDSDDKLLSEQYLLAAETFFELNPTSLEAHVLRSTIQAACGRIIDAEKSFATTYDMLDQLQWSDEMDSATKNDRIYACGILLDAVSVWNENDRSDLARKTRDYSMALASKFDEFRINTDWLYAYDYVLLSRAITDDGDQERALHYAQLAREKSSNSFMVHVALCEARLGMYQYQEAITDIDTAIALAPAESWLYKRRAEAHFHLEQFDLALVDLAEALELNPKDLSAVIWIGMGRIASCSDEAFRRGLRTLADRAVELNNESSDSLGARAILLIALGEPQQARKDLDALVAREDASFSILYRAALLALANDDVPRYQELCRQMLSKFESSEKAIELHFASWSCVLDPRATDDYAPALQLAQQAVDAEPENQQYINGLGAAQFRAGRHASALENFSAAAGSDESSATSSAYLAYFRAMTEYQLDRPQDATASLARANELALQELNDADDPPAWNRKLTLELLRKEAESIIGET